MKNKEYINLTAAVILTLFLTGCIEPDLEIEQDPLQARAGQKREIEQPEKIEPPDYNYEGLKYRSPFLKRDEIGPRLASESKTIMGIKPERLTVTGIMEDPENKFGLLSGPAGFFMVKDGRIFNDDNKEIPGVAAIIKEQEIIIITDDDSTYALPVPE